MSIYFENVEIMVKSSISDLKRFYKEIYVKCFPNKNERESLHNLIRYLKKSQKYFCDYYVGAYRYHIVLAKNDSNEIIGGAIFGYYTFENSGVIEFISIKEEYQSKGYGDILYNRVSCLLSIDSCLSFNKGLSAIYCEIDSPGTNSDTKYLNFWHKHNYKHLMFNYIQPSISLFKRPVTNLWLIAKSVSGEDITPHKVLNILNNYFIFGIGIRDIFRNKEYIKIREELDDKDYIELEDIIDNS